MLEQILFTACVTPFNNNNEVDYDSLKNILIMQKNAGNGVILLGSTGEGLSLSDKERENIIKFACKQKLNTEIITGVPNYNIEKAIDWIKFCNKLDINGYLVAPPVYTKPGVEGQTLWFKKILDASDHPVIAYNVPGRVGVELYPEVVKNISNHPRLIAIKDSSDSIEYIVKYKIIAPHIEIYCGEDYLMPSMAVEGSIGLISVASNAWPKEIRKYVQSSLKSEKFKDKFWWECSKALFSASNPIPIKALLKDTNIIKSDYVRTPLSIKDLKSRQTLINYNNIITER